ncbi:hypothetical protein Pd630_LPD01885 [Rhodococcus opacus PD630]|nr:hypothetical protein Pd630_LPD01885 [Rhodococcus opacus PD630]
MPAVHHRTRSADGTHYDCPLYADSRGGTSEVMRSIIAKDMGL